MQRYLKTEPFICVSSDTYFTFTKRRLKEAQNVLLNLARYRPSNFGISTGILMHMIRATCHSPIVKLKYLNDALRDVHFKEIMNNYGMFFLPNLDLKNHCILGIPSTDPVACKEAMSCNGKGHKPLMVAPPSKFGTIWSLSHWRLSSLGRDQSLYWTGCSGIHVCVGLGS